MALDEHKGNDLTVMVRNISFLIDKDLMDKVRPIQVDLIEFGGQAGFQITSRLPTGGCG